MDSFIRIHLLLHSHDNDYDDKDLFTYLDTTKLNFIKLNFLATTRNITKFKNLLFMIFVIVTKISR